MRSFEDEFFTALLISVFFIFCIAWLGMVIVNKQEEEQIALMESRECSLTSRGLTGKSIYCGKACWRKEIKEEYLCKDNGEVLVYFK